MAPLAPSPASYASVFTCTASNLHTSTVAYTHTRSAWVAMQPFQRFPTGYNDFGDVTNDFDLYMTASVVRGRVYASADSMAQKLSICRLASELP